VVGVSLEQRPIDTADLPEPVCEFCGNPIEALDKQCPALVNGRCLP